VGKRLVRTSPPVSGLPFQPLRVLRCDFRQAPSLSGLLQRPLNLFCQPTREVSVSELSSPASPPTNFPLPDLA
jgi:hypothetical protein